MNKVAGAMIAMFTAGAGLMTVLSPMLGAYSEATTLALLGAGLFAGSSLLSGSKETAPEGVAKEA